MQKKHEFVNSLACLVQAKVLRPHSLALHSWMAHTHNKWVCVRSEPRLWWSCSTQHRLTLPNTLQIHYSFDVGLIFCSLNFQKSFTVASFSQLLQSDMPHPENSWPTVLAVIERKMEKPPMANGLGCCCSSNHMEDAKYDQLKDHPQMRATNYQILKDNFN